MGQHSEIHWPPASGTHKTHVDLPADQTVSPEMRGIRKSAVYDRDMGLFRSRARKIRESAAAERPQEQTTTVTAEAEAPRREVTAESRPNPDKPGWGRTIGHEISKAREDRSSQG